MQTVLALPVQQKMRYSPAAPMPTLTASPTPTVSATSPSTSSTLSDNTSYSFTHIDAHINCNPALKIELPFDTHIVAAPKSKRAARRDPNVPFQYTFPTFPPSPGPSSASPTSEPVEQTQRLTKARAPPQHLSISSDSFSHDNPGLHCTIHDELLQSPDSGASSGPGPERHPKSGLARLLNENPQLAHPYARLSEKHRDTKRRKIWNHTLEKNFFTPEELSTIGAPKRRLTYIPSLEAHIDRIHSKLDDMGDWYPVSDAELEPFTGLNSKIAKSMVSGLQCDAIVCDLKLLELKRINLWLEEKLLQDDPFDNSLPPGPPGRTEFIPEAVSLNFRY